MDRQHGKQGSLFHRRLRLLMVGAAGVTALLALQMSKLAIVEGAQRRAAAEKRLDLVRYLPTTRGRIVDRRGRALAVDRPSYDVAVEYDVITGAWALDRAAARARSANRAAWPEMSPAEREVAASQHLAGYAAQVERLWEAAMAHGGFDRVELERRLDAIKQEVQRTAAVVWDRQMRRELRFGRIADAQSFRPRPIREQTEPHVLLPRVSNETAFAFRRLAGELPGVHVLDAHLRDHPWSVAEVSIDRSSLPRPLRAHEPLRVRVEGVADHVLGDVRHEVWAADVRRRPFRDPETGRVDLGGYRVGDVVGSFGLERAFEDRLRGRRGVMRHRLDSGRVTREAHEPGHDLPLTLDIALQARVQALLQPALGLAVVQQYQAGWDPTGAPRAPALPLGTPLDAAAVVLDVRSGEILALVSRPTLAEAEAIDEACRQQHNPWTNRPVEAIYPPGSIAKPLVLAAAVAEGVHDLDEPIECTGHYLANRRDVARCWIYREPAFMTHGTLAARDAISQSCNIYFYTLGEQLGMQRLSAWYERFGVGRPLDIGLLAVGDDGVARGEHGGQVPDERTIAELRAAGELRFASIIMGSGQGPVAWTPLHAAAAYAMFARGAAWQPPEIVATGRRRELEPVQPPPLGEKLRAVILDGLRDATAEPSGTGHHIRYPDGTRDRIIDAQGVTVWAKTGTAQAPLKSLDLDCDGEADARLAGESHAWFVGLVGPGEGDDAEPAYAIAVIVEHGGSGGRTAGPIANQIIRALQAEGCLPAGGEP